LDLFGKKRNYFKREDAPMWVVIKGKVIVERVQKSLYLLRVAIEKVSMTAHLGQS